MNPESKAKPLTKAERAALKKKNEKHADALAKELCDSLNRNVLRGR